MKPRPIHLAVFGLNGGTGRTTLTAHLARLLYERGQIPMAFDLDPQNALGLHLGMAPGEAVGLAQTELDRAGVADLLRRHGASVPYLPFGAATEQVLLTLEYQMSRDPSWLPERVADLIPDACEYVLMDTPANRGPWLRAALTLADFVLVVVRADASGFSTLPQTEAHLREHLGPEYRRRSAYVINGFDPAAGLSRDVLAAYQQVLAERVLPVAIQRCESVARALAEGTTVPVRSTSQVYQDFLQLTERLVEIASKAGTRPETHRPSRRPPHRQLSAVAGSSYEGRTPDGGRGRYHVHG